jgi:hypothetical protein
VQLDCDETGYGYLKEKKVIGAPIAAWPIHPNVFSSPIATKKKSIPGSA